MKQVVLSILAALTISTAQAQTPVLKDLNDSASYAIGISVANFYKEQGMKTLNTELVSKAITDVMNNQHTVFDNNTANTVLNACMTHLQAEKSRGTIEAGEKFLAENKNKPGIKTTASGLQYEVLKQGTGPKPAATDSVTCHYRGYFLTGGEDFDNSYKRGQPITFSLSGVIRGWTEGLQLMNEGSKYRLFVPYKLGYGAMDYMSIPGGSMLIFEVELIKVIKKG